MGGQEVKVQLLLIVYFAVKKIILDSHGLMLFIILYHCYVKEGVSCFLKIFFKFSFEYINVESIIRKIYYLYVLCMKLLLISMILES